MAFVGPPAGPPAALGTRLLMPCPIRRNNQTQAQIINLILQCRRPTYRDERRAWVILGYRYTEKPDQDDFARQVDRLWWHLSGVNTHKAREAKAAILDALEAIGYWDAEWTTKTPWLGLQSGGAFNRFSRGAGFAIWATVPGPCPRGTQPPGTEAAKESLWKKSADLRRTPNAENYYADRKIRVWQRYHRYQNFRAADIMAVSHIFKTIPIPERSHSLWDAISFHRHRRLAPVGVANGTIAENGGPGGFGYMHDGPSIKMSVCKYFKTAVADNAHPRFRDYNRLNLNTRILDGEAGEITILRHLHANNVKTHGKAAWPCIPEILHVVADFFATQIIVFFWNPAGPLGQMPLGGHQYAFAYSYRAFGFFNQVQPQIYLVTNDWRHYDACEFAPPDFGAPAPVPVAPPAQFVVVDAPFPHPWWAPGAVAPPPPRLVSNIPPYLRGEFRTAAIGVPPPGVAPPVAPGGPIVLEDMLNAMNYRDVHGINQTLPTAADIAGWMHWNQAPNPLYDIGLAAAPNNYAVRFGGPGPGGAIPLGETVNDPLAVHDENPAAKWMHTSRGAV